MPGTNVRMETGESAHAIGRAKLYCGGVDVGSGPPMTRSRVARRRYEEHFAPGVLVERLIGVYRSVIAGAKSAPSAP